MVVDCKIRMPDIYLFADNKRNLFGVLKIQMKRVIKNLSKETNNKDSYFYVPA